MSVRIKVFYEYYDEHGEELLESEQNNGDLVAFWEHIRMKSSNLCREHGGHHMQQATHMKLSSCSYYSEPNADNTIVVENLPFHEMNLDNVNIRGARRSLSDNDAVKLLLFLHRVHTEREREIGDSLSLIHSLSIWTCFL